MHLMALIRSEITELCCNLSKI